MSADQYTALYETDRPDEVTAVQAALRDARIPHRSGLLASDPPHVVISVPADRLAEARRLIAPQLWGRDDHTEQDGGAELERPLPDRARLTPFPLAPVLAVGSVLLLHAGIVLWMLAPVDPGRELLRAGGLLKGVTSTEPWRLVTSLFLHADLSHALWNGLSMIVFAVPLLEYVGYPRTAMIYFAAGIGGGVSALSLAPSGQVIIGSSGAVAGLFGAWIVIAMIRTGREQFKTRARIRTLGIALLVLPSLIGPVNSRGHRVSVSSHMGGLATGMVIGAAISGSLMLRRRIDFVNEVEP